MITENRIHVASGYLWLAINITLQAAFIGAFVYGIISHEQSGGSVFASILILSGLVGTGVVAFLDKGFFTIGCAVAGAVILGIFYCGGVWYRYRRQQVIRYACVAVSFPGSVVLLAVCRYSTPLFNYLILLSLLLAALCIPL